MDIVIQCSTLGSWGRFGNQLFQYCFCKAYARKHRCVFEVPSDWIGRKIFNIPERPLTRYVHELEHNLIPETPEDDINFFGSFQSQKALDYYSKKDITEWLRIKTEHLIFHSPVFLPDVLNKSIAAHRRSGDFVDCGYPIISRKSYIKLAESIGRTAEDILFYGDCEPPIWRQLFADTNISFITDFIAIQRSPIIFRGNSSFSWWAAALSNARVFSPIIQGVKGIDVDVEFVEGNHPAFVNYGTNETDLHLRDE